MNENQKNVKRVLVLDEDAIRALYSYAVVEDEVNFFPALYEIMNGREADVAESLESVRDANMAHVFWKAYGREVTE